MKLLELISVCISGGICWVIITDKIYTKKIITIRYYNRSKQSNIRYILNVLEFINFGFFTCGLLYIIKNLK